jgi:hypothetical protein
MAGPTYTYTADVPQPGTPFNQTQAPILANFQAINELIPVNHVNFNTSNTFGKHTFVNLQFQASDPTTASTDINFYSKASSDGNLGELFYRYPNNGTVEQLTPTSAAGGGGTASATSGSNYCEFPSGIKFKWGNANVDPFASNGAFIVFPTGSGIPAYTQYVGGMCVQPTASYPTNFTQTQPGGQWGVTEFAVYNNYSGNQNLNYFTVGL